MRLERIHAYHLVRVLRVIVPIIVISLISLLIWHYRHRPADENGLLPPPPRLVENVSELAEEIKFSRVEAGRTAFTVEARTNLGFADGRNLLEDVTVILYSDDGSVPGRRIHGDRCGYDQEKMDIQCDGNVEMQLDALTSGRTEAMTYDHESRMIQTLSATEIVRPGQFQGRADRMSLLVKGNVLEVTGSVRFATDDGAMLETESARYFQDRNLIRVADGLRMTNSEGTVSGLRAEIELSPDTLEVQNVRVWEEVAAEQLSPSGPLILTADDFAVEISLGQLIAARAGGRPILEHGEGASARRLSGGVLVATTDDSGSVEAVEAQGSARMMLAGGERLESQWIRSELSGSISTAGNSVMQVGGYRLDGSDFAIEQADRIRFRTEQPASIVMPNGSVRGERTEAEFDPATRTLISMVQTGRVELNQDGRAGTADRIELHDGGSGVVLEGNANISNAFFEIKAQRIDLNQETGSFSAAGAVRTVWHDNAQPVLVLSGRAEGDEARITFLETAELWSGATHVRAATIEVDVARRSFVAHSDVVSIIDNLRSWSNRMEFDEQNGILHHSGDVRALADGIELSASDLDLTLDAGEAVEVVAKGNVRVHTPEFDGRGDEAIYIRSSGTITLIGKEAEVSDVINGAVTGCRFVLDVETRDAVVESEDDCRVVSRRAVSN